MTITKVKASDVYISQNKTTPFQVPGTHLKSSINDGQTLIASGWNIKWDFENRR